MKQPRLMSQSALVLLFVAGGRLLAQDLDKCRGADALMIRLVHPDRQVAGILRLFEGSPSPHPAAALARWKRASDEPDRLGKSIEAVISLFNPEIVPEWESFHDARFQARADGHLHWRLAVPNDDGTLAALITALSLSRESPPKAQAGLDRDQEVESLGGGTTVATRGRSGVVLAGSRPDLEPMPGTLVPSRMIPLPGKELDSGVSMHLDPQKLTVHAGASNLLRRLIETPRAFGCKGIDGELALRGARLELDFSTELEDEVDPATGGPRREVIDPAWLDWIPARQAGAVICLATERRPPDWDRLFTAVDRVDRAEPSRSDLAPLRVRLNLFALASGAKLEADLWPHLRGVTLGVLAEPRPSGTPASALLCLHLDTEDAARRVLDPLLPRLVGRLGASAAKKSNGAGPTKSPHDRGAGRELGILSGRPLEAVVRGSTVVVGWGKQAIDAALSSVDHPTESVRPAIFPDAGNHQGPRPDRVGLFWPGRLAIPVKGIDRDSPLSRSLAEGPPVTWIGWTDGKLAHDHVRWQELDATIRRFLQSIPLEPLAKLDDRGNGGRP